jgi:hypothetical protein
MSDESLLHKVIDTLGLVCCFGLIYLILLMGH